MAGLFAKKLLFDVVAPTASQADARPKAKKPRGRDIQPVPPGAPTQPFVVHPRNVYVLDGDTISVRVTSPSSVEPLRLRVRLRSVIAPEMPKDALGDDILREVGIDNRIGHPGFVSRDALRDLLTGRAIFVEPRGGDKYGRLLADVAASGDLSGAFEPKDSFSVEHELIRLRMVSQFPGEDLPDAMTIGARCRPADRDGRNLETDTPAPQSFDGRDHPCLDWF